MKFCGWNGCDGSLSLSVFFRYIYVYALFSFGNGLERRVENRKWNGMREDLCTGHFLFFNFSICRIFNSFLTAEYIPYMYVWRVYRSRRLDIPSLPHSSIIFLVFYFLYSPKTPHSLLL